MHAEDDDGDVWVFLDDAAGGFDSVEAGHADVEDGYVGFLAGGEFDGFGSVGGFGYYLEAGLAFQKDAEASAHHGVIVGEENADGVHGWQAEGPR